ncbi:MAG: SMC-Scp complex subunit ScpB [Clostridiales bacterium]|nr:SMC-Scp complex subunit ScpB [Clostridiales bacterium]
MQGNELTNALEAMLFVAGEPVELATLATATETDEAQVIEALDALAQRYDQGAHGLCLRRFGRHVQLATRADYAPCIERMLQPVQRQSL